MKRPMQGYTSGPNEMTFPAVPEGPAPGSITEDDWRQRFAEASKQAPIVLPDQDVQRFRLEPGDVLVVTVPDRLTLEQADRIQRTMRDAFGDPDLKIVVLTDGIKLAVVNESELA